MNINVGMTWKHKSRVQMFEKHTRYEYDISIDFFGIHIGGTRI